MILGIDLGGTTCALGVLDGTGSLAGRLEIQTRQHDAPEVLLDRLAAAARQLLGEYPGIEAVGIGVPGPVLHREGVCVLATNLNGWRDLPVGPLLSQRLNGIAVRVLNDANAAALGEARFGAGVGANDLLVITLGTGIGSGLILNGLLHLGGSQRGAEIGHMTVDINDKRGSAGNVGTLESMCGRDAIVWRAIRALTWGRDSILHQMCPDLAALSPREIALAALEGDDLARRVWTETASYLAVGIVNAVFTADVTRVVLAGGIARAGAPLFDPLRRAVRARTSRLTFDADEIVPASLGENAGVVGAAVWAREWNAVFAA